MNSYLPTFVCCAIVLCVEIVLLQLTVSAASLTDALTSGVCLCVNEPNVQALQDPSLSTSVITTLSNGACFTSHGGVYHERGVTYYELSDNGQVAWVDSFYLSIFSDDYCGNATSDSSLNYHAPTDQAGGCVAYGTNYTHGQHFTAEGLHCTCDDGAILCNMAGQNCFTGGIVYKHGTSFDMTGQGPCSCSNGQVSCGPAVGK